MSKLNIILLITIIIVFIISLLILLFLFFNDKIKELLKKINNSELNINEKLNNKYNILLKITDLVKDKFKIDSKTFDEIRKINVNNLFKNEKELNKCFKEIMDIKDDNPNSKRFKTFKEAIKEYEENELHIISLRTFYNKYTMEYNNLIKKFPYNIVSTIKKYKLKLLFEGKEIEEED